MLFPLPSAISILLKPLLLAAAAAFAALHGAGAAADDWPQILGPQRNGQSGEQLAPQWPADGAAKLWSVPLGEGFAGAAVKGMRLVVFHRVGDLDRVECLHAGTGEPLWRADFAASYRGGVNSDTGPRCVPGIADGRVYAFSAAGDLHCLAMRNGENSRGVILFD